MLSAVNLCKGSVCNMSEDEIKEIVKNLLNTDAGFEFIDILLDKLGAFDRGCNFQNIQQEYFNRGKREMGLWLLDLVQDSNFNKFIEINKKRRNKKCQSKMKTIQD